MCFEAGIKREGSHLANLTKLAEYKVTISSVNFATSNIQAVEVGRSHFFLKLTNLQMFVF